MSKKYTHVLLTFSVALSSTFLTAQPMLVTRNDLIAIESQYRQYLGGYVNMLYYVPASTLVSFAKARGKTESEGYGARILKASLICKQGSKQYRLGNFVCDHIINMINTIIERFDRKCQTHNAYLKEREKTLLFYDTMHEFQLEQHNLNSTTSYAQFAQYVEEKRVDIRKVSDILLSGLGAKFILKLGD